MYAVLSVGEGDGLDSSLESDHEEDDDEDILLDIIQLLEAVNTQ